MKLTQELPDIFEEFESWHQEGFLEAKKNKENGKPLIGVYCTFFPTEIPMALDINTVSLCAFSGETIPAAELDLPTNLCPLIKSSYGFAKTQKCPYFYFADLVVGETTCDGKKKMYEYLAQFKDVYVMELPNRQSPFGKELWKKEIIRFKEYIEEKFERKLDEDVLREKIHEKNEERKALLRFSKLMALNPAPMTSEESYNILYNSSYTPDKMNFPEKIDAIIEKIMAEYKPETSKKKPRILITGCPIGGATQKVITSVEENGGIVVAFENCGGLKTLATLVDEENPDPYDALADKYLSIGCSCMTPNPNRFKQLGELIDEYQVDGVIDVILHACHTYNVETRAVQNFCMEEKGVPYFSVTTDYSDSDIGQLNTRIAAFIEML